MRVSNNLAQMVNLPTWILTLILTVLLLWKYLFLLTLVFLKLGSVGFWGNSSNLLNKGKSAIPALFSSQEVLFSASGKANCLLKTFLKILILMIQISLYIFFLLELI